MIGRGDFDAGDHGVKGSLLVNFGNSGVSWKTQASFEFVSGITAVTGFNFAFTPKFGMYVQGGLVRGVLQATLGANIYPVPGQFLVRPEVHFNANNGFSALVRLQRDF